MLHCLQTMVAHRCSAHPVEGFSWEHGKDESGSAVVIDRGDIDRDYAWIPDERIKPTSTLFMSKYTSASAARWCAACVHRSENGRDAENDGLTLSDLDGSTGLTVSIMNKRLLAMTNTQAMSVMDWVALAMCAYIVGLNIAGEVKDMMLCEMSVDSKKDDLSQGWQLALAFLGRLRSQILLAPLMGAIPAVVLTQGGSSLAICFNTIAVLFITEVPTTTLVNIIHSCPFNRSDHQSDAFAGAGGQRIVPLWARRA